jgi:hypothetical protein
MIFLVRRLLICELAYSDWKKWFKMAIFNSQINLRYKMCGSYLPRITRETCTSFTFLCEQNIVSLDIPMNSAMSVKIDESVGHFTQDVGDLLLGQALRLTLLPH